MSEVVKRSNEKIDAAFQEIFEKAREQENPDMVHEFLGQFSDEERMDILKRNILDKAPEWIQIAIQDVAAGPDPLIAQDPHAPVSSDTFPNPILGFAQFVRMSCYVPSCQEER